MQTQKFSKEFTIHYYEINAEEQASPLTLLYYLEDAAIAHSESVGYGIELLKSEALAWLLKRWHLQMERYPGYGEKVIVETWPSNFERFYGQREFQIKTLRQEVIGRATSLWIFYNTARKRPCRIHSEFGALYGLDSRRAVDDIFAPLAAFPESSGEVEEKEFAVRYGDIDTNWHVNNAQYLQWMLEAVPVEFYRRHRLASLEIQYNKETTYGSIIRSQCLLEVSGDQQAQYRHVIRGKDSGQELAAGKTLWLRK